LSRLAAHGGKTLGVGFLISLWSVSSGTKAHFDALNSVYQRRKAELSRAQSRDFVLSDWNYRLLLIALACVVALPVALNYFPAAGMIGRGANLAL
jgi:uncharacterized BrkB/YihY/UPF0761 family membrane protein